MSYWLLRWGMSSMADGPELKPKPKYELQVYRDFIRDAAPYVSIVAGRKLAASDADLMSDAQIESLALLIDSRVADLNQTKKS